MAGTSISPQAPSRSRRIAINAQIDPNMPGGVEVNIKSLLGNLPKSDQASEAVVLAPRSYVEQLQTMFHGRRYQFVGWKYRQNYFPKYAPPACGWWLWRLSVTRSQILEKASRLYRRVRYREGPKGVPARTIDNRLRRLGVGAVHFPYPSFFRTTLPFIYEPWDLQHLHYPSFFDKSDYEWRVRTYGEGCRRARLVIAATQWVKRDIVEKLGIAPEKVAVIPRRPTVIRPVLTKARAAELLAQAGVPAKFMFYPAMTFAHKNHIRLLQAMALLRDRNDLRVNLVLSGRLHSPHWSAVEAEVARLGLEAQLTVLGPVSEELLTGLFTSADFMVFPSLFEGLGLPLLEAFEFDLPVLAANSTCIPEVVGDAAWLFDGTNVEDIAATIARAMTSPAALDPLREAGRRRLDAFSWERAGATFAACYKAVLGMELTLAERALFEQAIGKESGMATSENGDAGPRSGTESCRSQHP